MHACHITSCNITILHWKIILKIIVKFHLICLTIRPTQPNWAISHLWMRHRLLTAEVVTLCHWLAFPQLSCTLSPPLLKYRPSCLPSPPSFQTLVPFNSEPDASREPSLRTSTPIHFPTRPPVYKRHRESRRPATTLLPSCPPNEDCRPPPLIFASQPIPLPRYLTTSRCQRLAPQRLPLSYQSVMASYHGP
jgi:hypothetical protein